MRDIGEACHEHAGFTAARLSMLAVWALNISYVVGMTFYVACAVRSKGRAYQARKQAVYAEMGRASMEQTRAVGI